MFLALVNLANSSSILSDSDAVLSFELFVFCSFLSSWWALPLVLLSTWRFFEESILLIQTCQVLHGIGLLLWLFSLYTKSLYSMIFVSWMLVVSLSLLCLPLCGEFLVWESLFTLFRVTPGVDSLFLWCLSTDFVLPLFLSSFLCLFFCSRFHRSCGLLSFHKSGRCRYTQLLCTCAFYHTRSIVFLACLHPLLPWCVRHSSSFLPSYFWWCCHPIQMLLFLAIQCQSCQYLVSSSAPQKDIVISFD